MAIRGVGLKGRPCGVQQIHSPTASSQGRRGIRDGRIVKDTGYNHLLEFFVKQKDSALRRVSINMREREFGAMISPESGLEDESSNDKHRVTTAETEGRNSLARTTDHSCKILHSLSPTNMGSRPGINQLILQ